MAVFYQQVFGRFCPSQCVGAFQNDGIVVHGVYPTSAHGHVLAAVDVHAVAVGIDDGVFYQQVIHSCKEHGKMTATQETESSDSDILTVA